MDDTSDSGEEEEEEEEEEEVEGDESDSEAVVLQFSASSGDVRFDFHATEDEDYAPALLELRGTARRGGAVLCTLQATVIDRDALETPGLLHEVADEAGVEDATCTFLHASGYPRFGELPTLREAEHPDVAHGALVVVDEVELLPEARGDADVGLCFVDALLRGLPPHGCAWTLAAMRPCAYPVRERSPSPPYSAGQEARERWHAERVNAAAAARTRHLAHACCLAARAAASRNLLPIHLELITLATLDPQQRAELRVCRHFARLGFVQTAPTDEYSFVTPATLRLTPRGTPPAAPITLRAPRPAVHAADQRLVKALRAQVSEVRDPRVDVAQPSAAVRAALREGGRLDRACALQAVLGCLADGQNYSLSFERMRAATLMLLSLGASPHAADVHGTTPLHVSADLSQLGAAEALLAAGARAGVRNARGDTPAHIAARHCRELSDYVMEYPGLTLDRHADAPALTRCLLLHGAAPLWRSLGLLAGGALTPRMRCRLVATAAYVCERQAIALRRVAGRPDATLTERNELHAELRRLPHALPLHDRLMPGGGVAAARGFAAMLRAARALLDAATAADASAPTCDAVQAAALAMGDAATDVYAYMAAGGTAAHALGGLLREAWAADAACGRGNALTEQRLEEQLAQLPHLSLLEDDFAYAAHALGVPPEYMNWEPAM
jgi:hypothetical protein